MKEIELSIFCHNIWGDFRKNDAIANRNECIIELADYYDADVCAFQECNPKTSRADECDIAKMLSEQAVYNKIAEETGASTATISRVNRSYSYGTGAYKTVLARLQDKN